MSPFSDLKSTKFWFHFKKKYWEKKPLALKGFKSTLNQIDAQSVFNFLLRYSDYCRENRVTDGLKLYVDGQLQYETELWDALPTIEDQSFQGYHKRMSKIFDDYCLVCDELSRASGEQWHLIKDFLRPLYEQVGIPNQYAEMGLYLGNYKKTPFGVHVDGCGVFSFPVVGKKKFRIWEPKFVAKNPELMESFSYGEYQKNSQVLEVNPGDFSYWPSTAWHIAESNGAFSATWSVGLWLNESLTERIIRDLKPILAKNLEPYSNRKSIDYTVRSAQKLPKVLLETIRRIKSLSDSELEDAFTRSWLITESKMGFKSAPLQRSYSKLKSGDRLVIYPAEIMPWAQLQNGLICLAVNGFLIEIPKKTSTVKLIERINSGEILIVGQFKGRELKLLETLYANFGLRRL